MTSRPSLVTSLFVALALAACGGGGDDDNDPIASTVTFPARAAFAAYLSTAHSDTFTVSGTCTGTATATSSAAAPATFEGVAGQSVSSTVAINVSNCVPATSTSTAVGYYDANMTPFGFNAGADGYGVGTGVQPGIPVTVKVGDNATVSTVTLYSNSTKQTVTGTRVNSFTVNADTTSTALIALIQRDTTPGGQVSATVQSTYRLTTSGVASLISINTQVGNTNLVITKN